MSSTRIHFNFYARSQARNGGWHYIRLSGTAEPPEAAGDGDNDDDDDHHHHHHHHHDLPDNVGTISIPRNLFSRAFHKQPTIQNHAHGNIQLVGDTYKIDLFAAHLLEGQTLDLHVLYAYIESTPVDSSSGCPDGWDRHDLAMGCRRASRDYAEFDIGEGACVGACLDTGCGPLPAGAIVVDR